MKLLSFLALFSFALTVAAPEPAHAVVSSATAVRILFSSAAYNATTCIKCGNVTVSTWQTVVDSLSKAVKGVSVYNTAQVPFQLAIGASGSEVVQLIIPSGHDSPTSVPGLVMQPGMQFYPIPLSQGSKVAIRALDSSATANEADFQFYYY